MSDSQIPRIYGEKEIGRILKRATQLQHKEPTAPAAGLTLSDLEDIASEAGIDLASLRRAAREVDAGRDGGSVWRTLVGDDLAVVREIELEGELPDIGFERILAAVQLVSKDHGQPALLGRTLTWRAESANKTRTIQMVVSVRDGRTLIRFEENLGQLAAGLFGGTVGGGGVGFGIGLGLPFAVEVLGSGLFAVAAPFAAMGLSYVVARAIYRNIVARRSRAADEIFDRAVTEAREAIASEG